MGVWAEWLVQTHTSLSHDILPARSRPGLNAVNDQGQQQRHSPQPRPRNIAPHPNAQLHIPIHPSAQSPSDFITCAHEQLMLQCHTSAEGEPNQYCDYGRVALIKTHFNGFLSR